MFNNIVINIYAVHLRFECDMMFILETRIWPNSVEYYTLLYWLKVPTKAPTIINYGVLSFISWFHLFILIYCYKYFFPKPKVEISSYVFLEYSVSGNYIKCSTRACVVSTPGYFYGEYRDASICRALLGTPSKDKTPPSTAHAPAEVATDTYNNRGKNTPHSNLTELNAGNKQKHWKYATIPDNTDICNQ